MPRAALLALALLLGAPSAAAGVPFVLELEDARGDVRTMDGRNVTYPSADVLRVTSTVENGTVRQRVELAAPPKAPEDHILVRSWFHNSTNGTFWVIDLEVFGSAPTPEERFRPLMRRGAFDNVTYLPEAVYGVDGSAWVFAFPGSLVEDATCFDPGVFTDHTPKRAFQGFDSAYLRTERRCLTAEEPVPPLPPVPPAIRVNAPSPDVVEPPGSRAPTPAAGAWAALGAIALVAALTRRR